MDAKRLSEKILRDMSRLEVMRQLSLINSPREPFFDTITQLASLVIGTPVSLITMVSDEEQFFKSSYGLPEPWQSNRCTPLTHSFCQHIVTEGEPLIINDAREHPLVEDNLAIPDLNVIGYLGMPLQTASGQPLGSFCVIDSQPHPWTQNEISVMWAFGEVVNAEIDARSQAFLEKRLDAYIAAERPGLAVLERDLLSTDDPQKQIGYLLEFRDTIAVGGL